MRERREIQRRELSLEEQAARIAAVAVRFSRLAGVRNAAHIGDVFMSFIHTCELCGANAFDYLTELERHADEAVLNPQDWMPWNYRRTLDESAATPAATR